MRKTSSNIYSNSANRVNGEDFDDLALGLKIEGSKSLQNNSKKETSGILDDVVEAKSKLFENIVGYDEIKKIFNFI